METSDRPYRVELRLIGPGDYAAVGAVFHTAEEARDRYLELSSLLVGEVSDGDQ